MAGADKGKRDKEMTILAVATAMHFNFESSREAFHVACYGITSECPFCGEAIEK